LPTLAKLSIEVEVDFPSVAPVARVFAGEIMQVALELINNARDALSLMSSQESLLRISLEKRNGLAVLQIENNGGDIPLEVLPHIYDPYYTTKDGVHGAGLGLYMAKLIVENHHDGVLFAESAEGKTKFTCTIPMEELV